MPYHSMEYLFAYLHGGRFCSDRFTPIREAYAMAEVLKGVEENKLEFLNQVLIDSKYSANKATYCHWFVTLKVV